MPRQNISLQAWNRGIISPLSLARTDIERTRLSAETMTNWMPRTQGAMSLRPGLGYLGASKSNLAATWIDFVGATDDTALLEITNLVMRVWISDALMTRGSVSSAITTGDFSSATGWTEANTGGGDCTFGGSGLTLNATNRGGRALCHQTVTVGAGDQNDEHALRIVVSRGPVTFKCGSTQGADNYIRTTTLRTGTHSLAFTPTGNFVVQFESAAQVDRIVTSIAVEGSGTVEITAPWATAALGKLRWTQSADVIFVACEGYQQYRIERRGTGRSWSVVKYAPDAGPYQGKTDDIRLKVAATYGNTTLTADKAFFTTDHVGALFRLFHTGAKGTFRLAREGTYTDPFLVSGITGTAEADYKSDRVWTYSTSGTWVGTVTMQRSVVDKDFGYTDFEYDRGSTDSDFTANQSGSMDDEDDNLDVYYRLGFKPGEYTSGAIVIALNYEGDGGYGVCRVVSYSSSTVVNVEVLQDFRDTNYTEDWVESSWSASAGWPTSGALFNGRLWWSGGSSIYGSVSDDYENFDPLTEGDSAPINRTIGEGPVDVVNFMLPLQRLILGTAGGEISVRSTSFDEPITATNMSAKQSSSQGSAELPAVKVDNRGIFVQRSGQKVFEIAYSVESNDHASVDLTQLIPDLAEGTSITALAVQRQPDTRVHFVLADGSAAILSYQPADQLLCWSKVSTTGTIEKVVVLPGSQEDQVYYHVNRTINGSTVRYLEKWAKATECVGGTVNKQADAFGYYSGVSTTTPTGFSHLEGASVVVWADGIYVGTKTVSGGTFTLDTAAAEVVAGLSYSATYKSTKLAYASAAGTALTQRKRVNYLGLILADTHYQGLEFGPDFTNMDGLPLVKDEQTIAADTVHSEWDMDATNIPDVWSTDSRLCLRATAPKPCTLLAAVISVETSDRV